MVATSKLKGKSSYVGKQHAYILKLRGTIASGWVITVVKYNLFLFHYLHDGCLAYMVLNAE